MHIHTLISVSAAALTGGLELLAVYRLKNLMFGAHRVPAGIRWLLLCLMACVTAWGLSEALIYISVRWFWTPWAVGLGYLTLIAERERRANRAEGDAVSDTETED